MAAIIITVTNEQENATTQFNYVVNVQGGLEGDRVVLRGVDSDGFPIRWSFNEIKAVSFVRRGEKSRDGGKTWKIEEEHYMKTTLGIARESTASTNRERDVFAFMTGVKGFTMSDSLRHRAACAPSTAVTPVRIPYALPTAR